MGISCKSFGKVKSIEQKLLNKRFEERKQNPKEESSKKKKESVPEKKKQ